jgi:hypothetical protein
MGKNTWLLTVPRTRFRTHISFLPGENEGRGRNWSKVLPGCRPVTKGHKGTSPETLWEQVISAVPIMEPCPSYFSLSLSLSLSLSPPLSLSLSLCRPGWPQTQRSACLCLPSAGIKNLMGHYHRASTRILVLREPYIEVYQRPRKVHF